MFDLVRSFVLCFTLQVNSTRPSLSLVVTAAYRWIVVWKSKTLHMSCVSILGYMVIAWLIDPNTRINVSHCCDNYVHVIITFYSGWFVMSTAVLVSERARLLKLKSTTVQVVSWHMVLWYVSNLHRSWSNSDCPDLLNNHISAYQLQNILLSTCWNIEATLSFNCTVETVDTSTFRIKDALVYVLRNLPVIMWCSCNMKWNPLNVANSCSV